MKNTGVDVFWIVLIIFTFFAGYFFHMWFHLSGNSRYMKKDGSIRIARGTLHPVILEKHVKGTYTGRERHDNIKYFGLKLSLAVSTLFVLLYFVYPSILINLVTKINII